MNAIVGGPMTHEARNWLSLWDDYDVDELSPEIIGAIFTIRTLLDAHDALVAYVKAFETIMDKKHGLKWYTSKEYWDLESEWQALPDWVKEEIEV